MSGTRVEVRPLRLLLVVTALALLAGAALGGPLPAPTIPAPVGRPGTPLPPTIEFALEDGTRPCMETSVVPAVRYRVSLVSGGIRFVEIKRVLSDRLVTDGPYMWPGGPTFPASKEERRISDRHAADYARTLVGYKLETEMSGSTTVFSKQIPFHFLPAMSLRPEGILTETIGATTGRGGATVNYELVAQIEGINTVSVRGESAVPSSDPRSVTISSAVILTGSPARLKWTIHWPDGTEALWRGARAHGLTARQWGTCGERTLSVGPLPGFRR